MNKAIEQFEELRVLIEKDKNAYDKALQEEKQLAEVNIIQLRLKKLNQFSEIMIQEILS